MNFKIIIFIAFVSFTTCNLDFLEDDDNMNSLKKEMRKGHRAFAKCLKQQMTQPDQDINDLIIGLKEEDYETIGALTMKLWKEGNAVRKCLKPNNDENGINWKSVLKCAEGIIGLLPCGKNVIAAIAAKSIPAVINAILFCPSGIRGAIRSCLP